MPALLLLAHLRDRHSNHQRRLITALERYQDPLQLPPRAIAVPANRLCRHHLAKQPSELPLQAHPHQQRRLQAAHHSTRPGLLDWPRADS